MALAVRTHSEHPQTLMIVDHPLPSPFLHLRLAIETVSIWDRALITYIQAFHKRTTTSAKIAANQALERQIAKMQLQINVVVESEEDEELALQTKIESLARNMIAQRYADFTFAGVRSEKEFKQKKRQLNRYKANGLELYFKADAIDLKKKLDCAFFSAIRGQANALESQCLDRYWDWISDQAPWSHLYHWNTEVEICKRICKSISEAVLKLNPREKPHLKANYGSRLKASLTQEITYVVYKLGGCQVRDKERQIKFTYMMYKVELLKGPILCLLLRQKLAPLIRFCEEEIQKLALAKKHKKNPLKSAHKEWIQKRKEYDPLELRKILAEETPTDRIVIKALSMSMGHDLERTFAEQEFLDMDIATNFTARDNPSLYLRYLLLEHDEKALSLLCSLKA